MQRYFFVITGATRVIEDDIGAMYESPDEAQRSAGRIARDLAEGNPNEFQRCSIKVLDEVGAVIAIVTASYDQTRH